MDSFASFESQTVSKPFFSEDIDSLLATTERDDDMSPNRLYTQGGS